MKTPLVLFSYLGLPAVILSLCSLAHGGFDSQKVREKALTKLSSQEIKLQTDISAIDLADFFGVDVGLGLKVRPNDDKKTFSREEKLTVDTSADTDFADIAPWFLKVNRLHGVRVVRQFESQAEAWNLTKNPKWIWKDLPYSAKNALQMPERSFVSYTSRMAFEMGANVGVTQGITSAGVGGSILIFGDFLIEVFKQSKTKVLVRFVSRKEKSAKVSGKVGLFPQLEVFGVKYLDKKLSKKVVSELKIAAGTKTGHLFVLEYVYDLADPAAQEAFNQALNPDAWQRLSDLYEIASPFKTGDSADETVLVRFDQTEVLVGEQKDQPHPTVVQNLQGEADYRDLFRDIEVNVLIAQGKSSQNFVEMDFEFEDVEGHSKEFRLANFTLRDEAELLKGALGIELNRQVDVVLEKVPKLKGSSQEKVWNFQSMVLSCFRDEATRHAIEQKDVGRTLNLIAPERYHQYMRAQPIVTGGIQADARSELTVVIGEKGFDHGSQLSVVQIREVILDFLRLLQKKNTFSGRAYYGNTQGKEDGMSQVIEPGSHIQKKVPKELNRDYWALTNSSDLSGIVSRLPQILSSESKFSEEERWAKFTLMRENKLFIKIAAGIFTRVIDHADQVFGPLKGKAKDFVSGSSLEIKTVFRKSISDKSKNSFNMFFGEETPLASYGAIDRLRLQLLGQDSTIEVQESVF